MAEHRIRAAGTPATWRAWQGWRTVLAVAFILGEAVLVGVVAASLPRLGGMAPARLDPWLAATATLLYLAGHLLRAARLALLLGDARLSLRLLLAFHFWSAAVSLSVPFKAGDLLRAAALAGITRSAALGVTLVWVERALDAAVLLPLLLLLAILQPASMYAYAGLVGASVAFTLLSLTVLFLVPDNLRRIGTLIFRRYDGRWAVLMLRAIKSARATLTRTGAQLHGRWSSLVTYSLLIWSFETATLATVLAARGEAVSPVSALLSFISRIAEGQTLPSSLRGAAYTGTYVLLTQVPLLVVGVLASVVLVRSGVLGRSFRLHAERR